MLKAVILDDEPHSSSLLRHKLQNIDAGIQVVAVFGDPAQALCEINAQQLDVLFLDVEMPGMNGFQFLERLGGFDFEVIFTTAHDSYTLEALRLSAVDYLLKPIGDEELEEAIARLKARTARKASIAPKPAHAFASMRLSLSTAEGVHFIEKNQIIRIEAMSNYCTFYLAGGRKIMVSKTLKAFEAVLVGDAFVRVNRSSVVNLHYINRYRKGNGGTLELADGMEIEVSPQRKEALMAILFSG
ncbi:two component transcriptional regulator, LytTR family [Parapedobacter koreensis]|uniref:Two component transcriptional regulator, LytTR family n=2 Tax=Parapedobacter koreensis TaxID=332977 RepID=A0A1H7QSA6_9SPHI|nr:two component transcriptional regulator, LytTR family [Parapedobacter koreensis]